MTKSIAIALAVIASAVAAPAAAQQESPSERKTACGSGSCVDDRPEVVAAPAPRETVILAPRLLYLPDPEHSQFPVVESTGGEFTIASALNASLDRWRVCGWDGYEQAAAIYNAWARTHYVADKSRANYGSLETAWDVLGRESAIRTAALEPGEFNSNPEIACDVTARERIEAEANMKRQASALVNANTISRRAR